MYVLAVDDEQIMLKELTTELGQVFPDAEIRGFQDPQAAQHWAAELAQSGMTLSYAFMDIRMRGMNGIELARQLKLLHPDTVWFSALPIRSMLLMPWECMPRAI